MPGGMTFEDVSGDMRLENRTGVGGRQEIKLNVFPSLRALIANGLLTRLVRERMHCAIFALWVVGATPR